MMLLEATGGGQYSGLVILILLVMFGPALLLGIIGSVLLAKKRKRSGKVFLILAVVYLLISLGTCSSMIF